MPTKKELDDERVKNAVGSFLKKDVKPEPAGDPNSKSEQLKRSIENFQKPVDPPKKEEKKEAPSAKKTLSSKEPPKAKDTLNPKEKAIQKELKGAAAEDSTFLDKVLERNKWKQRK